MVMWAVFLLLSPLLFLGVLVFGIHFMSADEIGLMKVLLVVLGPFAKSNLQNKQIEIHGRHAVRQTRVLASAPPRACLERR